MTCPHEVAAELNVSRETMIRLERYVALLAQWNSKINLVSTGTLQHVWRRHILDSAQVFLAAPTAALRWVDLGSGAGFPGAVVALLAEDRANETVLIEADQRKATFLRTVLRECNVQARVLSERIEEAAPQHADVVSARALAPLTKLLGYCERHMKPDGIAIFPKGASALEEVAAAQEKWSFTLETAPSVTDANASLLKIGDIKRV